MPLDLLPALWRAVPSLQGRHASLEPLQHAHADALRAALHGSGLERLWYTSVPAADQVDGYVATALDAQAQGRVLPFVVRDAAGAVVGSTRCYGLDPEVPTLLIGYTWYAPRVQRSGVNTEVKRMLLQYAFETLRCLSVGFETSWFNHTSRAAIARLGAKQDGVLRNHKRHPDGTPRDTVVFSIIDTEWAGVKRHLQFRLDSHT
ncbi:GNAT family N-acetyltransferase [Xanthomonas translucens]|uniref:GNAT family N-acetyltransferase n=1 Tax=Xanthomonas campestris pv. translucens TaxID=343 RepID=UPI000641CF79|nr:GNAT family N-acetyltransferase [Xanthomonas translucens]AKK67336.1 acetyltransferase [Xanthomonas translucens pv. undulosa]MBC3971528.1 GNAT family N-acetyltransferase [Xanthomonas translucens pv. undulosa]MCT8269651.1 GNAT family N-acetyltransferase [Xanthomonas translucens pv. undulosa]QSQ40821.1 GNAT family N-acetyltransferase [Xanthomonas translucens pv. translucens]QSQ47984.1 GNAT family N-acetyltransferase [Xanthomonas translucens pv. undulosa]